MEWEREVAWLRRMVELEEGDYVSVGGWVSEMKAAGEKVNGEEGQQGSRVAGEEDRTEEGVGRREAEKVSREEGIG